MNTTYDTDRLVLRICTRREAPMVLDFYKRNLEDFSLYEPVIYPAITTLKYHEEVLEYEYQAFLQGTTVRYYFFEKDNPFMIVGTMSFRNITGGYYASCTLGYKVDTGYRRLGYAREALAKGISEMERGCGIHRTEAYVMPDNEASMKLLGSLGFELEGLLHDKIKINGEWKDHYLYARIAR